MSWLAVGDYASPAAIAAGGRPVALPMASAPAGPPPVDPAAVGRAMTAALQQYMVMTGRAPAPAPLPPPAPKSNWPALITVGVVSSLIAGYAAKHVRKAYRGR